MKKIYRELTEDQKKRGIVFSSRLSIRSFDAGSGVNHEVKEKDPDREETIRRLKDDSFFNGSSFKYNIIRS